MAPCNVQRVGYGRFRVPDLSYSNSYMSVRYLSHLYIEPFLNAHTGISSGAGNLIIGVDSRGAKSLASLRI